MTVSPHRYKANLSHTITLIILLSCVSAGKSTIVSTSDTPQNGHAGTSTTQCSPDKYPNLACFGTHRASSSITVASRPPAQPSTATGSPIRGDSLQSDRSHFPIHSPKSSSSKDSLFPFPRIPSSMLSTTYGALPNSLQSPSPDVHEALPYYHSSSTVGQPPRIQSAYSKPKVYPNDPPSLYNFSVIPSPPSTMTWKSLSLPDDILSLKSFPIYKTSLWSPQAQLPPPRPTYQPYPISTPYSPKVFPPINTPPIPVVPKLSPPSQIHQSSPPIFYPTPPPDYQAQPPITKPSPPQVYKPPFVSSPPPTPLIVVSPPPSSPIPKLLSPPHLPKVSPPKYFYSPPPVTLPPPKYQSPPPITKPSPPLVKVSPPVLSPPQIYKPPFVSSPPPYPLIEVLPPPLIYQPPSPVHKLLSPPYLPKISPPQYIQVTPPSLPINSPPPPTTISLSPPLIYQTPPIEKPPPLPELSPPPSYKPLPTSPPSIPVSKSPHAQPPPSYTSPIRPPVRIPPPTLSPPKIVPPGVYQHPLPTIHKHRRHHHRFHHLPPKSPLSYQPPHFPPLENPPPTYGFPPPSSYT